MFCRRLLASATILNIDQPACRSGLYLKLCSFKLGAIAKYHRLQRDRNSRAMLILLVMAVGVIMSCLQAAAETPCDNVNGKLQTRYACF